eukprot:c25164_g9_i2 orf=445-1119(+)
MAATTHQLWNLGLSRCSEEELTYKKTRQLWNLAFISSSEEDHKHKKFRHRFFHYNSKDGPACLDFKHKSSKEFLGINCHRNSSSQPSEELRRIGLAHDGELGHKREKVIHDKSLLRSDDNDDDTDFVALLRACAKNKDLYRGTRAHDGILKRGLLKQCLNPLIAMYVKCDAFAEAEALLYVHNSRDVFAWTALIAAYAQKGQAQNALNCFEWMQREGLSPDAVT